MSERTPEEIHQKLLPSASLDKDSNCVLRVVMVTGGEISWEAKGKNKVERQSSLKPLHVRWAGNIEYIGYIGIVGL